MLKIKASCVSAFRQKLTICSSNENYLFHKSANVHQTIFVIFQYLNIEQYYVILITIHVITINLKFSCCFQFSPWTKKKAFSFTKVEWKFI